jgi:hypothetical protein
LRVNVYYKTVPPIVLYLGLSINIFKDYKRGLPLFLKEIPSTFTTDLTNFSFTKLILALQEHELHMK